MVGVGLVVMVSLVVDLQVANLGVGSLVVVIPKAVGLIIMALIFVGLLDMELVVMCHIVVGLVLFVYL